MSTEHPYSPWKWVIEIQNQLHLGWKKNMLRTMLATGLASEVGGVCDQVAHLDGGGSRLPDPEKWNEGKVLHELVDTWVMVVLVATKSGFTEEDFLKEWENVKTEFIDRIRIKLEELVGGGEVGGE